MEKIKVIIKELWIAGIILVLIVYGFVCLSRITERKDSRDKFSDFYTEDREYEVLFLGSSHVLNGIFPMELWKEYGITSYNMGGHGNRMAMNYWVLKNALEYKKPKVVVLDTFMIGREDKIASLEQLHLSADHIPYSQTKVEMIEDLVEEKDRRKDFLFKFSTYHHRWNELTQEDFQRAPVVEKGAESRINVAVTKENMEVSEEDFTGEKTVNTEYLYKIIKLCEEQEIELLLTYLPFPDSTGWRIEANTVDLIAKECNLHFLDYNTLLQVIDFETDFYDKDSHLNTSGARKITRFIGDYLRKIYKVNDYREWEEYIGWHEDYKDYYEFKIENFRKEEELKNILMMLNDEDVSYGIYFKPWNAVSAYPQLLALLNNMGIDYTKIPNEDYFLVKDRVNNIENVVRLFEVKETAFGEFSLFYNEDGHLELSCIKADSMILTYSDIGIVVFNNYNLSVEDQKKFTLSEIDIEFMNLKE